MSICGAYLLPVRASLDPYLSYQGRLSDQNGNLLTGNYYITFCLYTTSSPATACAPSATPSIGAVTNLNSALWGETEYFSSTNSPDNHLINGVFNAKLGSASAFPSNLFSTNSQLWLGVNIYNGSSWDGQMSPLQEITSAGYALNAGQLSGYTASLTPGANQIPVLDASGNLNLSTGTKNIFSAAASTTTTNGLLNIGSGGFGGGAGNFSGSSSGTLLAMNAVSGYGGSLADFQLNGTSFFKVDAAGNTTTYAGNLTINNLTAPTTAPTLSGAGGGSLSSGATYYGEYTWYNSDGQTTASAEAGPFSIGANTAIQFTIPTIPTGATGAKLYLTPANGASGSETYQTVTITSGTTGTVTAYVSGSAPPVNNTAGGDLNANRLIVTSKTNSTSGLILNNTYASASTTPQIVWEFNGTPSRYLRTDSSNNLISLSSSGAIVDTFDNSGNFLTPGNDNIFSAAANAGANYGVLNIGSGGFTGGTGKFAGSSSGTELAINAPSGFNGNLIDAQTNGVSQWKVDAAGNMTGTGNANILSAAAAATSNNGVLNIGVGGFSGGAGNFAGSASGTLLAINAAAGYSGDLVNVEQAGGEIFEIAQNGSLSYTGDVISKDVPSPTSSPTLGSVGGGTLGATTYYVEYAWNNANGRTLASSEASLAVAASHLLSVTIPSFPAGVTSAEVYVATLSGAEKDQGSITTSAGTWTEPTSGIVGTGASPNTANFTGARFVLDALNNSALIDYKSGNLFFDTSGSGGFDQFQNANGAITLNLNNGNNTLVSQNNSGIATPLYIEGPGGSNMSDFYLDATTAHVNGNISVTGNDNILSAAANAGANYGVLNIGSGGFAGSGGNFAGSSNGTELAINAPSGFTGSLLDAQLNGTSQFKIDEYGHIISVGSTPSASALSNDGTSPPSITVTGSDTAGTVVFGSGTAPSSGDLVQVTFAHAYTVAPVVYLSCYTWNCEHYLENATTLGLIADNVSTTGFQIFAANAPPAGEAGSFFTASYIAIQP